MAAHVFDATEPTLSSTRDPIVRNSGAATTTAPAGGPMFASQPAVFQRMHERSKVGVGPVIGLVVGALLVGGTIYGTSRHHQAANAPAAGIHATTQAPAMAAATPAPSPVAAKPAPAALAPERAAPKHLRIVAAPPRPVAPLRVARAPARAHTAARVAPGPAPESTAVAPPAPLAVTPAPQAAAPAPVTPPTLSTPAPQPSPDAAPTPAPAPALDAGSAPQ